MFDSNDPGIEPQTSHTDIVILATELFDPMGIRRLTRYKPMKIASVTLCAFLLRLLQLSVNHIKT